MTDRADTIIPTAADIVAAVRARDTAALERILTMPELDWQALAVVLADNVGCVHDIRIMRPRKCGRCGAIGVHPCITSPKALTDGKWVTRRGVRYWRSA